jgi:hypothetical protein
MRIKVLYIVFFLILSLTYAHAQKNALTRPFKYARPTLATDLSIDDRKSPYLWQVFIDREGVQVYKDKNLRNIQEDHQVAFMDRYIVADETETSLLIYSDPNVDSTSFSDDALEIGWVDKKRVVLWERFLWGNQLTKLLALSTWNKIDAKRSSIFPNEFKQKPNSRDDRYFIFNVVKKDIETGDILISLRTFNHRNPDLFCWVKAEDLFLVDDRNGYIPNREFILDFGANNPTIYDSPKGSVQKDLNAIAYYIDTLRADEGFIDLKADLDEPVKKVKWLDEEDFHEGYLVYDEREFDQGKFKKGLLVNRQEFSIMKKTVELLVRSRSKEEYKNYWKFLYEDNNMTFYEGTGQYQLFEELVRMRFNYPAKSDGATVEEISFMSEQQFDELKRELELSLLALIRAESDSEYPYNFAPFSYPHYWMPLDILPLATFEKEYNLDVAAKKDELIDSWLYDPNEKEYETFDLFYIDNSHDYNDSFELKDQVIKSFYRRAARIRPNDPNRGSMIYYSNVRNPAVGSGEKFTEDVAGMMRESVASRPNRRIDKKEIRSHLYAKNVKKVERLKIHFYIGSKFFEEALQTNRWLLEELANEFHFELGAEETEVILYLLDPLEDQQATIAKLNTDIPKGLRYIISIIEL